jgi:glycosyltransferase involved in cell wall biosynthesis
MNKKVLIIVENLPVPFDKRVWHEAKSLYEAGYDVTVLCPRAKNYHRRYEFLDGIRIYRHPMPREGDGIAGYLYEYAVAFAWEVIYTWWIYFTHGIDIIQGCNPPDNIFLVTLPFKLLGVKYVFDHHDAAPELYLSKRKKNDLLYKIVVWLEKQTYRAADVVMCTNNSYRELAIERGGLHPDDVFVVRNGPDLRVFKAVVPKPELRCGKDYLVAYVGNMGIQEGLDILLDVAQEIKAKGRNDIQFTCVGGGPALPALRQMVREKNLQDMVTFTGRISDLELLQILSTADVCVNPDTPCEMNNISTMIKIMEYMALGKPIVQFDMKEGRVSAVDASLYADPREGSSGFADKILWLLGHPEERRKMGEFGRKRVEEKLAWKHSVDNLLSAYSRVVGRGQEPSSSALAPAG